MNEIWQTYNVVGCLAEDVEQEANANDPLHLPPGGHCLPVAVKVEPEEDVSVKEIFEEKSVEDYVTEQEFVQEAKAPASTWPETGQVEAGEVSSPASSAQVN